MFSDPLSTLLGQERPVSVVDIGANPVDGIAPYQPLIDLGVCRLTGFEPLPSALETLRQNENEIQTFLPYAVGDGAAHTLYVCRAQGMSSLLKPDRAQLRSFNLFSEFGEVISEEMVDTVRLDDVSEIGRIDYLKIDVQGSELTIFRNGRESLSRCVILQTEVSFTPLYENQPLFSEVDQELREQGFRLHSFYHTKRWSLAPLVINENPRQPLNQLLEADAIYVRGLNSPDTLDTGQLKALCLILHHCYASYDLAFRCLRELVRRQEIPPRAESEYLRMLPFRASLKFPR